MGRLTEDYGKQLLKKEGIKIPPGSVACSPGEASKAAGMLNFPVYVKALVPVGKRGKAGAVKKAANAGEVYKAAEEIMNNKYYNYPVKRVLVEEALEITRELFASITFDFVKRSPVAICGSSGGVDVEEIRRQSPEKIKITEIDPVFGLNPFQAVGIWKQVGLQGSRCTGGAVQGFQKIRRQAGGSKSSGGNCRRRCKGCSGSYKCGRPGPFPPSRV